MADIQDSAKKNHYNELNQPNLERLNAKGIAVKCLIIKQLELEYFLEIAELKLNQNIKTTADAIRWALKRANGKV